MKLFVNGAECDVPAADIAALLTAMELAQAKVATALNGEFVPARARSATKLREGDKVEIVAPRQGG